MAPKGRGVLVNAKTGFINEAFAFDQDSLKGTASDGLSKENKTFESDILKPVPYLSLFRYSRCSEKILILLGIFLGLVSGVGLPVINVIYGEFANLLVERQFPTDRPSSKTWILEWFGGGKILVNATDEERRIALHQDSEAFGLGCASLSAFQWLTSSISVYFLNYTAHKQIARIRKLFFRSILCKDMGWFDTQGANTFASNITDDLRVLGEGIGGRIGMFSYLMTTFLAGVVIALCSGWELTLAMVSTVPIVIGSSAKVAQVQSSLTAKELASYGKAGGVAEEVIGSIRTVAAFNGEKVETERFSEKLKDSKEMGIKRGMMSGLGGGVLWLVTYCCYAVAFVYGVRLIVWSWEADDTKYTPGILIIVFFGIVMGATNMGYAIAHVEAFATARGAAANIYQVLSHKPIIDPLASNGRTMSKLRGEIIFQNIYFHYPSRPDVKLLKGLNLKINAGEVVAIVGSSGSGKSTLLHMMQRLYDPVEGDVYLDGENLKSLKVSWLRQQMGVVGQEPMLFATTIAENIRYGSSNATAAEIEEAAKKANAHDFIMKLEDGYETVIGQKGSTLSGGQKQRIAIARALIRNPKILLLDEATSALDSSSEKLVQMALDQAAVGRTTLIVTHRLSTITNANRIVVVSNGVVAEMGTHSELVAKGGLYNELLKSQASMIVEKRKDIELPTTWHSTAPGRSSVHPMRHESIGPGPRSRTGSMYQSCSGTSGFPEDLFATPELEKVSFWTMLKWNKPEWHFIFMASVASIIVGAALPAVCILFGDLYGFLSLQDYDLVVQRTDFYGLLLVAVGIIAGIGVFLQMYFFAIAGMRMTTRLRIQAFSSIIHQDMGWFDEEVNSVGALCSRLSQDAAGIQGATGGRVGVMLQAFSTIVLGASLSFFYSWKMTLVTLITVPFVFSGVYLETLLTAADSAAEQKALQEASKIAIEAINNIRVVASLGKEPFFMEKYNKAISEGEKGLGKKARVRGVSFAIGQTAPFFGYALSLWYGGTLVADEGLHYQNVIKVSEILIFGAWMLGQSVVFAPSFGQAKMSAARLQSLFNRKPEVSDGDLKRAPEWDSKSEIRYHRIGFAYPTRPDQTVLRGLGLDIKSGQSVALVGPSGSGKSTVIQLLQRLYDPTVGQININDVSISRYKLAALRSQLGLVGQEPVLFDRTIKDNIAYGDNSKVVSDNEVIAAAKTANIHSFISSLPLGYETRLGSGGAQLSGGQKQRIAIARALVRNPKILLLDEATSALDPQSEKIVQAALDSAASGRTTITIAHRLGAIINADIIYVLDKGKVVESGTHARLMQLKGLYYDMHTGTVSGANAAN